MNENLKPCPFCGGDVKISPRYDVTGWKIACRAVYCATCEADISFYADGVTEFPTCDEALIVERWNRRV